MSEETPAQIETLIEKPAEMVDTNELARKLDAMQLERLTELHKSLRETEARIDKKLQDFKRFVDTTEISGRSLAGKHVEKSDDDKRKDAANSLLAGTGLKID